MPNPNCIPHLPHNFKLYTVETNLFKMKRRRDNNEQFFFFSFFMYQSPWLPPRSHLRRPCQPPAQVDGNTALQCNRVDVKGRRRRRCFVGRADGCRLRRSVGCNLALGGD